METRRKRIKDNWEQYKCNPSIMPFASYYNEDISTTTNFTECMATMQNTQTMSFLEPVYGMMDSLTSFGGGLQSEILDIQKSVNVVIGAVNDIFSTFFIMLANILSGIYKILANMKDTTERIVAMNELMKVMLDQTHAYLNAYSTIQPTR
tara:strand:- start:1009 stop:1458 length:450 start_codon:yes stop_codon:yes gene_type:complete